MKKWIDFKYPILETKCLECKSLEGFIPPHTIDLEIFRMAGIMPGKPTSEDIKIQKKRGMIRIGMSPKFYENGKCIKCDDCWAIDYSHKRGGLPALHKGRDLPMPFNTPVLAMADGIVVGLFKNEISRKGIEVVLRHTPEQTNLPFFTYTQYTHFNKWPLDIKIGQEIKVGDILGPNGNSGKRGESIKKMRRPALHFAVFKSESPNWSSFSRGFLVKDGYWMDPVTFFKKNGPYEHKKFNKKEKKVVISYKTNDGKLIPDNTKKIWPFSCDPENIAKRHPITPKSKISRIARTNFDILVNIQ